MPPGRVVEVTTLDRFDALVAGGARRMHGWRIQGLDLRERKSALSRLDPAGALLLGCELDPAAEERLRAGGAVVFPDVPDAPVDAYRTALYTADELYAGLESGYETTLDATVYAWSQQTGTADPVVRALHDEAIDRALTTWLGGRRLVGVMGGHAVRRDDGPYLASARLGRALARSGLVVGTGGGPGAMEAANLGARMAGLDDRALDDAVVVLAAAPSFRPSIGAWATTAFDVRRRWPAHPDAGGIGVPTWFYGHEPPNAFAAAIAKYFQNSVREATLLRRADAGIVFLPGAAGTVQEVFQDACENYYAEAPTVAPMVLVGVDHWTRQVPAWPLLRALAAGRDMSAHVHLVDDVEDVPAILA